MQVGDTVQIRPDLAQVSSTLTINEIMRGLAGKEVTIKRIGSEGYIYLNENNWTWLAEWLVPVSRKEKTSESHVTQCPLYPKNKKDMECQGCFTCKRAICFCGKHTLKELIEKGTPQSTSAYGFATPTMIDPSEMLYPF